jgi:hypothetical protein
MGHLEDLRIENHNLKCRNTIYFFGSEAKRTILTLLRFELVLAINIKVVGIFLSFPTHIYTFHLDQPSPSYDPRNEQNKTCKILQIDFVDFC